MISLKSQRARRHPAAANAMKGYIIIERLPPAQRSPSKVKSAWPDFLTVGHDAYLLNHPAYFGEETNRGENRPARPRPENIDKAMEWILPCRTLWEPGRSRRDWKMFQAYARDIGPTAIAGKFNMSRTRASYLLDRIFHEIETEAFKLALGVNS